MSEMRITGPGPGFSKEPQGSKPIEGKEGNFASVLQNKTFPNIIRKLADCVSIQTNKLNAVDYEVIYKVDQAVVQNVIKQLHNLQNLSSIQTMHVQEAVAYLKNVENMADSHDALALEGIKKARQELEMCLKS